MEDVAFRYLHFIGIMLLGATLVAEHLLLAPTLDARQLRRLAIIDGIYGFSAVLVLIAGLLLWSYGAKSPDFYSLNWVFHLKVAIFIVIALISIYPTLWFLKQRSQAGPVSVPRGIILAIRIELLLLLIMPLLAVIMSRGYGLA